MRVTPRLGRTRLLEREDDRLAQQIRYFVPALVSVRLPARTQVALTVDEELQMRRDRRRQEHGAREHRIAGAKARIRLGEHGRIEAGRLAWHRAAFGDRNRDDANAEAIETRLRLRE